MEYRGGDRPLRHRDQAAAGLRPGADGVCLHASAQPRAWHLFARGNGGGRPDLHGGVAHRSGDVAAVWGIRDSCHARPAQVVASAQPQDAAVGDGPGRPRPADPILAGRACDRHPRRAPAGRRRRQLFLCPECALAERRLAAEPDVDARVAARLHRNPLLAAATLLVPQRSAGAARAGAAFADAGSDRVRRRRPGAARPGRGRPGLAGAGSQAGQLARSGRSGLDL